jgi:ubiquinone/menaquinone biosynthesis C-methylase UbiE
MAHNNILYRGLIVEYWDLLRGDTSKWSSRPYFLKIIQQSGEPALDVACGSGRLLIDYLAEGIDIDGVDISSDMIAACRVNADNAGWNPNLYVQAMQDLVLPRRYRTIIVPSSSFLHLTNESAARQALDRFYTHLEPGGVLSMSMRVFEPDSEAENWEIVEEATRPTDGATVRRWFRCTYDIPNRLQFTEDRYEILMGEKLVQAEQFSGSPYLTWYTVPEAIDLLKTAGFLSVEAHADFTFNPAKDTETSFVILGRRPPVR